jgi:hypothetical protein
LDRAQLEHFVMHLSMALGIRDTIAFGAPLHACTSIYSPDENLIQGRPQTTSLSLPNPQKKLY